jgi:hypothetical protein
MQADAEPGDSFDDVFDDVMDDEDDEDDGAGHENEGCGSRGTFEDYIALQLAFIWATHGKHKTSQVILF